MLEHLMKLATFSTTHSSIHGISVPTKHYFWHTFTECILICKAKVVRDQQNHILILCEKVLVAEVSTMVEIAKYNDRHAKMLSFQ